MGVRIKLIFVGLFFVINSCSILNVKDDPLSIARLEYTGANMNLDGYWWAWLNKSHEPRIFVYFLYSDGTVLSGNSFQVKDIEEKEASFSTQMFRESTLRSKTGWGVFQINNDEIKIETWVSSTGGPLKTGVKSGRVINPETFVINSFLDNYSGKRSVRQDTFYFKSFSPKPDSTNTFIP